MSFSENVSKEERYFSLSHLSRKRCR